MTQILVVFALLADVEFDMPTTLGAGCGPEVVDIAGAFHDCVTLGLGLENGLHEGIVDGPPHDRLRPIDVLRVGMLDDIVDTHRVLAGIERLAGFLDLVIGQGGIGHNPGPFFASRAALAVGPSRADIPALARPQVPVNVDPADVNHGVGLDPPGHHHGMFLTGLGHNDVDDVGVGSLIWPLGTELGKVSDGFGNPDVLAAATVLEAMGFLGHLLACITHILTVIILLLGLVTHRRWCPRCSWGRHVLFSFSGILDGTPGVICSRPGTADE